MIREVVVSLKSLWGFLEIPVWVSRAAASLAYLYAKVLSSLTLLLSPILEWDRSPGVLTLRPDFRGKGRRASNLPGVGQDGEDGWLQGGQDEENLQGGEQ